MNRYIFIVFVILASFQISCNYTSDKERTKVEFGKIHLSLNDNFDVVKLKSSGLTDYTLDIEIKVDSSNFDIISEFIRNKHGFFIGDTTTSVELFNKYPYLKDNQLFWEEYRPTKISYEYRRIQADLKTRIIKFHYLDEE